MRVDTVAIRQFLDSVSNNVVEIERADLLKLLDAADEVRDPAPRVPLVKLAA